MKRRPVVWSRDALDELKATAVYIARDNPAAARRVAAAIRTSGRSLGEAATGRPGRVSATYEKTVAGLPYVIAYAIDRLARGEEAIIVLRVIHSAREWPEESWPQ